MRKSTHERHARRFPALLAFRPLAPDRAPCLRRRLSSRLACAPPSRLTPLARRSPRRLPRWPGGDLPGPGIADRAVRRPASASPHAAAPAADDGGAAAALVGRAAVPLSARTPATRARLLGRSAPVLSVPAVALWVVDPSADGAAHVHRRHLVLASAAGLRPGCALKRMALLAACLLPRRLVVVLVSRRPAVPQPAPLVALAPVPVPDRC